MMFVRVSLGVLLVVLAVGLAGPALLSAVAPDEEAPADVERILPSAKRYLASQLDLYVASIRYVGWEHRDRDHLVILRFEVRPFPFITVDRAFLVSRCTPIENLDPVVMDAGRGIADFETDPELEYLRSDAQPSCD